MNRNSSSTNRSRKHATRNSFVVVGGMAAVLVGVGIALTPGISVGAFSQPVGQFSNPSVSTQSPVTYPPIVLTPASSTAPTTTKPVTTTVPGSAVTTTQAATVSSTSAPTGETPTTKAPTKTESTAETTTTVAQTSTTVATTSTTRPATLRITRGSAKPGRSITITLTGFGPRENVTWAFGGRELKSKADSSGRATLTFTIPRDASVVVMTATSPTTTRTLSIPVKR